MASAERTAWIMLVTSVPAYIVYVVIVLAGRGDGPLHEAPWAPPALIVIGASIVANIIIGIIGSIVQPRDNRVDERDRQIDRYGEQAGNSVLIMGALAAMLMAMAQWHWFWIGNAIMLAFFLGAVIGSLVRISAYRGGLQ